MNQDIPSDNSIPRRRFLRKVGTGLLAINVVSVLHVSPSPYAAACGGGTADSACYPYYSGSMGIVEEDANCGVAEAGNPTIVDQDNHCSLHAESDSSCANAIGAEGSIDPDDTCSTARPDESCRPVSIPDTGNQVDEHCEAGESDAGCSIAQNTGPGDKNGDHDQDAHCSAVGATADGCCGDCEDNHQIDEHCGKNVGTQVDADELCGHVTGAFTVYWVNADSACGKIPVASNRDSACGAYDPPYSSGTQSDPDATCGVPEPDQECTVGIDSTCARPTNPSSTSPDESCGAMLTPDEACGHYDRDANCSVPTGDPDQGCGWKYLLLSGWFTDPDNACTSDASDISHSVSC